MSAGRPCVSCGVSSPADPPAAAFRSAGAPAGSAAAADPGAYRRIAARHLADGDPTGWFEPLYAAAEAGQASVPWDVPQASAQLRAFPLPAGEGRRALVVGCGPGRDAEHVALSGYATTAFDISPSAIALARERHGGSAVDYVVADLLNPPESWHQAFDLVLESNNVQALPQSIRAEAIAAVGAFVAPGGTLLVLAAAEVAGPGVAGSESVDPGVAARALAGSVDGPPWPLTRDEIDGFAVGGLALVSVELTETPESRLSKRWRAVFHR
jgi:SAM-dependent methyltransferase